MKHIVFLVGEYKPYLSPNGNIANNLIQELKNKYRISVITRQNDFTLKKKTILDGVNVIRITDYNMSVHKFCIQNISKSTNYFTKQFYKIFLFLKRIFFFIPRICRRKSVSDFYIKKIQSQIIKLNLECKIDILIPVSAPHEEVFASVDLVKKNKIASRLIIYQLDRFSNANSLYETNLFKASKQCNNIRLEIEALKVCDYLVILPPLKLHFNDRIFKDFSNKIIITEHPLVRKIEVEYRTKTTNDKNINILYAGSLDVKLRNPTYLFKLLNTEIIKKSNILLHLYSFGNCQLIIDKYKIELDKKLLDFGRVSSDEITYYMTNCDILITIGNNSDNEVPSKLFEYLSFCKPIIHLYYTEMDSYLQYLEQYENSICLKMDDELIEKNSKLLFDFCNEHQYSRILFDEVEQSFQKCTPHFVAKQFIDLIEI